MGIILDINIQRTSTQKTINLWILQLHVPSLIFNDISIPNYETLSSNKKNEKNITYREPT